MDIQSTCRGKKLHRMNQGSNFLGGTVSDRGNVSVSIQFRRDIQPQHLNFKDDFSSRTDPSIVTSLALVLLDQSNPALKSTSHLLPQSRVPCRSDSSSEATSGCYHRSDARSHLE